MLVIVSPPGSDERSLALPPTVAELQPSSIRPKFSGGPKRMAKDDRIGEKKVNATVRIGRRDTDQFSVGGSRDAFSFQQPAGMVEIHF